MRNTTLPSRAQDLPETRSVSVQDTQTPNGTARRFYQSGEYQRVVRDPGMEWGIREIDFLL